MMKQPESQYQSYLLRLWRAGEEKAWRVMLEHVGTHERYGFTDLEGLCVSLQKQMNDQGKRGEKTDHVQVQFVQRVNTMKEAKAYKRSFKERFFNKRIICIVKNPENKQTWFPEKID